MSEAVNHPKHYQKEGRKECIKEMEGLFGVYDTCMFCLLNAHKYIYRAGEKKNNDKEQDLKKAEWYIAYAMRLKKKSMFALSSWLHYETCLDIIEEELANVES